MEPLTRTSFLQACRKCLEHITRICVVFGSRGEANDFLYDLSALYGEELKEEFGVKRYIKDFGIEFKNGSSIRVITPNNTSIRGRRYETLLYSDYSLDMIQDGALQYLRAMETNKPFHCWSTSVPDWLDEITYKCNDLGELDCSADLSVLFGN